MLKTSGAEQAGEPIARLGEGLLGRRRIARAHRQMQLDLSRRGENRRFDWRLGDFQLRIDRLQHFVDVRLAAAGRRTGSRDGFAPARARAPSAPAHSALSIGCSSRGGPGSSTTTLRSMFDELTRGRPVRIVEDRRASQNLRLPAVDVRHLQSASRKPLLDAGRNRWILDERHTKHLGDRLARQIVVCRTEAAGQDEEIAAIERLPAQAGDARPLVAHHGLRPQLDAQRREAIGDEKRIRVEAIRTRGARSRPR